MTKQEFLDTLGRSLKRELSEREVAENLHYYEQYIAQQISSGRTEDAVLRELGDPRLIAKTILQVDQSRDETVYTEDEDGTYRQEKEQDGRRGTAFQIKTSGMKSWIILILVLILICMLVSTVFRIALKLLPVLLTIAVVIWLYRKLTEK